MCAASDARPTLVRIRRRPSAPASTGRSPAAAARPPVAAAAQAHAGRSGVGAAPPSTASGASSGPPSRGGGAAKRHATSPGVPAGHTRSSTTSNGRCAVQDAPSSVEKKCAPDDGSPQAAGADRGPREEDEGRRAEDTAASYLSGRRATLHPALGVSAGTSVLDGDAGPRGGVRYRASSSGGLVQRVSSPRAAAAAMAAALAGCAPSLAPCGAADDCAAGDACVDGFCAPGDGPAPADGGRVDDGGRSDGGARDAGDPEDAGHGAAEDGGGADGGVQTDGGVDDGGVVPDGGLGSDGGGGVGSDGGGAGPDAGDADAGAPDAGVDPWHVAEATHRVRVDLDPEDLLDEVVADVRLLVALPADRVADPSSGGADLVFTTRAGAVLPHEIDRWGDGGTSLVWVRVPSVGPQAADAIWAYSGATGLLGGPASSATAVWDGFVGVWHLNAVQDGLESTGNIGPTACAHDDTTAASLDCARTAASIIGLGAAFDQGRALLQLASGGTSGAGLLDVLEGEARTISTWFHAADLGRTQTVLWKNGQCRGWSLELDAQGRVRGVFEAGPDDQSCAASGEKTSLLHTASSDDGFWHHVAFVVDRAADDARLYVDGQQVAGAPLPTTQSGRAFDAHGGTDWDHATPLTGGGLDEIRVARGAWSSDAIRADFLSGHGRLAAVGPREAR